ncbi:hypothetical protein BC832DRAFT_542931 [Gaertneriomyces semiglobifer]|nr:hypothetical protein BC832DRAFT_542931 [Gaertneriomyces semiglobifer]
MLAYREFLRRVLQDVRYLLDPSAPLQEEDYIFGDNIEWKCHSVERMIKREKLKKKNAAVVVPQQQAGEGIKQILDIYRVGIAVMVTTMLLYRSDGHKKGNSEGRCLPKDDVAYENLQRQILLEITANNSRSFKQMFRAFCKWMSIEILPGSVDLMDEDKETIRDLYDSSLNMFSYDNIADITKDDIGIIEDRIRKGLVVPSSALLEIEKYEFSKRLNKTRKAMTLYAGREYNPAARIIYDFYEANNLNFDDSIPQNAIMTHQCMGKNIHGLRILIPFRSSVHLWYNSLASVGFAFFASVGDDEFAFSIILRSINWEGFFGAWLV